MTLSEVLEDLSSRFIINVPDEELASIQRVCFQIEQAHWFYEDFVREVNPNLGSKSLKNFSLLLFQSCPLLRHWAADHDRAFSTFMEYKVRVPVCGTIILNEDLSKVLLVRGWKASAGWGFPKGKINQGESETSCAIREVFEETGFDASGYLRENEYVERVIRGQRIRLFILSGLLEDTEFITQTRKEIGDIKWHSVNSLPGFHNAELDANSVYTNNKKYKYYMVTPFVPALRKWIQKFKKAKKQGKARRSAALKVIMDTISGGDSDVVEEDSEPNGNYSDDYVSGQIPLHLQVNLESSLKNLLGIGNNTNTTVTSNIANQQESESEGSIKNYDIKGQTGSDTNMKVSRIENNHSLESIRQNSLMDILLNPTNQVPTQSLPQKPKKDRKKGKKERKPSSDYTDSDAVSFMRKSTGSKSTRKQRGDLLKDFQSPKKEQKEIVETEGLLKLLINTPAQVDTGLQELLTAGSSTSFTENRRSLLDILEGVPPPPVIIPKQREDSEIKAPCRKDKEDQEVLLNLLLSPKAPTKNSVSTSTIKQGSDSLMDLLLSKPPEVEKPKQNSSNANELLSLLLNNK